MSELDRRVMLKDAAGFGVALLLGGCMSTPEENGGSEAPSTAAQAMFNPGVDPNYVLMYGPVEGERFPIARVDLSRVDPAFLRRDVDFATTEAPGTIVVDPASHYLYFVEPEGRAVRYGVGVGKQGFEWSGVATINSKQEWPDWYPAPEMLERRPDIVPMLVPLQSGMGIPGGPRNPIGARGLYLWQNNKDTLYRIHGTNEPHTIGHSVSSGCIRMINQDVIDLYARAPVGTEVKVLPAVLA